MRKKNASHLKLSVLSLEGYGSWLGTFSGNSRMQIVKKTKKGCNSRTLPNTPMKLGSCLVAGIEWLVP